MTNGDIEKMAEDALSELEEHLEEFRPQKDCSLCVDVVASAIETAVAQAYEEAAKLADYWGSALTVAPKIRALRDLLVAPSN